MKKTKNTRRHKIGNTWNEMNYTDRANWLSKSGVGHSGWARESWWNLTEDTRQAFISHIEFSRAAYAYR